MAQVTRPFFVRDRISDMDIMDRQSEKFLQVLADANTSYPAFDIQDLFLRFTMDVACEFLFGITAGSLDSPLPIAGRATLGHKGSATDDDFGTFTQAFEAVQVIQSARFLIGDSWPLFELFSDKSLGMVTTIQSWSRPNIERAIREAKDAREAGVPRNRAPTLLDHLIESIAEPDDVQFELLNVLMAARDTTGSVMAFVIYLLCLHPDVAQRLRSHVFDVWGKDGQPSYATIQKSEYMQAVLNETLRIFPPVAMGVRYSRSKPSSLPSDDPNRPFFMPGSTQITLLPTDIHRNKAFWGEDADEFRPDRWLDPALKQALATNPQMFIPFFQGPRICPGQQFAMAEATYLLARILQKYRKFELCPEYQPAGSRPPSEWKQHNGREAIEKCWPASAFTLHIKGGLWVRATLDTA
ncbi:hypothetical protein HGRIS_003503 [Hohenbuehelia grisea]|uniref:Cytochrome P450 n=1 Tax=Hohenbuehelia grisea TaxID=104357 RepID=A0ABR3JFT6_9AGAR